VRTRSHGLPAVAASCLLVLGLSACSSTVSTDDLETQVEKLAVEEGVDVDSVDCPDALPAEVDESVVCTVTQKDGKELDLDVTTTSVEGDTVNFDVKQQ
jgi:hypothetical protein